MEELQKQALTEHLGELRHCLVVSLIATAIGFGISYYFVDQLAYWYLKPLHDVLPKGASLIFTSYQEAFFFI